MNRLPSATSTDAQAHVMVVEVLLANLHARVDGSGNGLVHDHLYVSFPLRCSRPSCPVTLRRLFCSRFSALFHPGLVTVSDIFRYLLNGGDSPALATVCAQVCDNVSTVADEQEALKDSLPS